MILTNLRHWTLSGAWPYTPIQGKAMETGEPFSGVTDEVDAVVPGSIYADLMRAGLIEDPYYGRNSLHCEWVANRWWIYTTRFSLEESLRGKRLTVTFLGIDYKARIYVNGQKLAEHENMYTPCSVDFTDVARFGSEQNQIRVLLENAPEEMGQIGYTSRTHTQKARFNYKWDFCTRLVNLGLWDEVLVCADEGSAITDAQIRYENGIVSGVFRCDGNGTVSAELAYAGDIIAAADAAVLNGQALVSLPVESPKLWYPNGTGEQPLYDLSITLRCGDKESDKKSYRVGLRTLAYTRCDGANETALPYIPVINGKRIYLKGVNCTPFDMMYGCVDEARYRHMLTLARDAGVNLIRVWGGGIIERECFYRLCDEYGIMVWQEFIQSSSGIDNEPSELPEFLEKLADTADAAVRRIRNHVSLTYYSGGNELYRPDSTPVTYQNKNIAMLREITSRLDPDRLMLPTSASGPLAWQDNSRPADNHDVHGPWKYAGCDGQYELFNNSPIQLHSEFGVDGMTNYDALHRFLPEEDQRVTTMGENLTWRHHGEWWDTYGYRDRPLFGELTDLKVFCRMSQFMQGEGIRYALEANRRRAFANCGSILWQFNEPWPNVSCTCIVDYYGTPKFAYLLYKDAMRSLHVSLRYDHLTYRPGDRFTGIPFVHDDSKTGWNRVECRVENEHGEAVHTFDGLDPIAFDVAEALGRTFTVVCRLYDRSGTVCDESRYLYFVLTDQFPHADTIAVERYMTAREEVEKRTIR